MAKSGLHPGGRVIVVLDGDWFGGGSAGVDRPTDPVVCGPVADQVFGALVEVVGDDVDGVGLAASAHGDVGEFSAAAVFVAVSDVDR